MTEDFIKKSMTEDFIKKSIEIHGNLYDYSNVNYIGIKSKIIINCHIHGEFEQTPELKIDYCKENNIQLYIIKYDEDIKEKMDIILKNNLIYA